MFCDYKTKILVELKYGRSRLNILQQSKVFFELFYLRHFMATFWKRTYLFVCIITK